MTENNWHLTWLNEKMKTEENDKHIDKILQEKLKKMKTNQWNNWSEDKKITMNTDK